MAANLSTIMDVDSPVSLKRSNSAPMINELNSSMSAASAGSSVPSALALRDVSQHRTRRFSGSFSPHHSAGGSPRPSPRVSQLRQEECLDVVGREAAHEKELHSAMQMSQSCEDLTIVTEGLSCSENESSSSSSDRRISAQRPLDPLHVNLPQNSPNCSSPSPTRSALGRSVFGPWKSNLSPSPTRSTFTTRRSLSPSPITMRPSSLNQPVKRKFDLEEEKSDHYITPPAKRSSVFSDHPMTTIGGGLLMTQPQRLEQGSSPLPTSLSSAGTPDSLSSADSPNFSYRPLDSPSPARALTGPAEHSPS